jgi:hypothetical protein
MMTLIPIVLLGLSILALSVQLLVQQSRNRQPLLVTIEDYTTARAVLDSIFVETMATQRIFAKDDLDFVARTGSLEAHQVFLKERQALAARWLRVTQKQVAQLMNLHLKLAGYTNNPSPRFEFSLALKYAGFVAVSNVLLIFLWLRGPFNTVRIVAYTLGVAQDCCSAFSARLENTDPVKLGLARSPRHA